MRETCFRFLQKKKRILKDRSITDGKIRTVIEQIAATAGILWDRGWAERNAGNISVNITGIAENKLQELFTDSPVIPFDPPGYRLEEMTFILTATGSRMRELAERPEEHLCFIRTGKDGNDYRQFCLCPGTGDIQPTSELPAHLMIHEMLLKKPDGQKAVVHTHATELIALTHFPEFRSEEAINRLLWRMHPETIIFLPEGAAFVPFTIPGTRAIAEATRAGLEKHNVVIWEKHGVFATGRDVAEAFDHIDLLTKAARIWLTCRSAGFDPVGLSDEQLAEIKKAYNL
jgi:rhamnulose-1-phosphate aldolase